MSLRWKTNSLAMILIMKRFFITFCRTHHTGYCASRALYKRGTRELITWVTIELVWQVIIKNVSVGEQWWFPSEVDSKCVRLFVFDKIPFTLQLLYRNFVIIRYLREKEQPKFTNWWRAIRKSRLFCFKTLLRTIWFHGSMVCWSCQVGI